MRRIARSTYRRIYGGGLILGFLALMVCGALSADSVGVPLAGAWLFWLVFGRRIAFHLVPLFVSKIRCPGCAEEHETVRVWNCHCGFKDHRARTVFAKCPNCENYAKGIDCPTCDATILLW